MRKKFCIHIIRIVTTLLFMSCCPLLHAKGKMAYNGYSGGMMLHTGYVYGGESTLTRHGTSFSEPIAMKGMPLGLGGALRVCFGDYLRVGAEGYSTTLSYNKNESYASTGWGGALVDCAFRFKERHLLFIGATLGGGSYKNLTLTHPTEIDWEVEENASYRKYGFMALTPFMGYEYALTSRIHLVVRMDYLLNISNPQPDFSTGPRLFVGFMFCRTPKKES